MSLNRTSPDHLVLRDINFRYESASTDLFSQLNAHFSNGFTGIVGPNGAGKSTLLQLVCGQWVPEDGTLSGADDALYCAQRTDSPPDDLYDWLDDTTAEAFVLRGKLGVEWDFVQRWQVLSHGERKRAQIGCALWRNPPVLAIDEPTNHIDDATRQVLLEALRQYQGVGLIVSHDRELLDALCQQCLWLEPGHAAMFSGGYSHASEQRLALREEAQKIRQQAKKQRNKLQQEANKRRDQLEQSERKRSKRGLSKKDHDAKARVNHAIVADGGSNKRLRQLDGRLDRANRALDAATVQREHEQGIWMPGAVSKRNTLFDVPAGNLLLGADRVLQHPALSLRPDERVAITGANGLGKSTLVSLVLEHVNVPDDHLVVMPQELDADQSAELLENVKALSNETLGQLMNIVSRLGSDPARLLGSVLPSPGEVRKLLLALGMVRTPHLLVLDEPTNHLDLPSIEALELALADCPCGLVLVSHDTRFLQNLTSASWRLVEDKSRNVTLTLG